MVMVAQAIRAKPKTSGRFITLLLQAAAQYMAGNERGLRFGHHDHHSSILP
jgi:hypothetical protein